MPEADGFLGHAHQAGDLFQAPDAIGERLSAGQEPALRNRNIITVAFSGNYVI
jgi:hypothetical protein